MSNTRIYHLAKELGIENKVIIERAKELGIKGKTNHSNALSDEEVKRIKSSFSSSPAESAEANKNKKVIVRRRAKEVVRTTINKATGEEKKVVEKREGNVIRRRKKIEEVKDTKTEELSVVEESSDSILEETDTQTLVDNENTSLGAENEELTQENTQETAKLASTDETQDKESDTEKEIVVEKKVLKGGPKVLGKIDLPIREAPKKSENDNSNYRRNTTNKKTPTRNFGPNATPHSGQKKRGRKKEFSRSDLDYTSNRNSRRKNKSRGRSDSNNIDADSKPITAPIKESKKLIKIEGEAVSVGELAKKLSLKVSDVISKLINFGIMATINQMIDLETAEIIADEFGYKLEFTGFDETEVFKIEEDPEGSLKPRSPVVTVMGHVDHGKTSLLDYIRSAKVADKEFGGITQHIGAYTVEVEKDKKITFIDTPGHAAFTSMRARGANVTDIVILVVAADDGIMPQTIEAINHSKAAGVTIVVAINKMDVEAANPDRIKQQLSEHGLVCEDWGGDVMCFPVSAKQGDGIDKLLEGVLLSAEILELQANPDKNALGTMIEVRQEKGRGTVATVLIKAGTLKKGDIFISGAEYGKVRSLIDHHGKLLTQAGPATPVEITGLNGVPRAGDDFIVVESENAAREVSENRKNTQVQKEQLALAGGPISLEEFAAKAQTDEAIELNVIIKADVQGSIEAVKNSILKLSTAKVEVKVIHSSVGGISESDIQLGIASKAIIVGFNVRGEPRAITLAEQNKVEVRFYRVIYELVDDIKLAMVGLLDPDKVEAVIGRVKVRETFSVPKIGTIAGAFVTSGMVKRNAHVRLLRDSVVIYEGVLDSLKRFKDDVKEVQSGYECGLSISGYNDIKIEDEMEIYEFNDVAPTLD